MHQQRHIIAIAALLIGFLFLEITAIQIRFPVLEMTEVSGTIVSIQETSDPNGQASDITVAYTLWDGTTHQSTTHAVPWGKLATGDIVPVTYFPWNLQEIAFGSISNSLIVSLAIQQIITLFSGLTGCGLLSFAYRRLMYNKVHEQNAPPHQRIHRIAIIAMLMGAGMMGVYLWDAARPHLAS
jgi:hypothetical protein